MIRDSRRSTIGPGAALLAACLVWACGGDAPGARGGAGGGSGDAPPPVGGSAGAGSGADAPGLVAFTGLRLWDGTGAAPQPQGVLVVRDGRVEAAGPAASVQVPAGARRVDLSGRTVIPGLLNAHGHVGVARGLDSGPDVYTRENVLAQLALSARYGITTVVSLGGGGPLGVQVRDDRDETELERARLFLAGPVLDPATPAEARARVAEVAEMGVDWVKIRVDDNLDRTRKMPPEVYRAVADAADRHGLPLAAHVVELSDAKGVVRAGADLVAHSVRDAPVDEELIGLLRERDVCVAPTLTREVSTFVYADRPDFFDDPFFRREADPEVMEGLVSEERRRDVSQSAAARWYRDQFPVALRNLSALSDAGVGIAFSTDSGPVGRFQGYFEHMEMELMARAGLSPERILISATREAARCMGLDDSLGTLEPGKWADFVVLRRDPLSDVRNVRAIESVWVAGSRVPDSRWGPGETGLGAR